MSTIEELVPESPVERTANYSSDEETLSARRRLSQPTISHLVSPVAAKYVPVTSPEKSDAESVHQTKSELLHEIDSLREALQQALEDKAELIEESFYDKERIREQRETIESLTKRIREFEMTRSATLGLMSAPTRTRSAIKQLSDDNAQLTREVDRLTSDRDRIERKLIDLKLRYASGIWQSGSTQAATSDEDDNDTVLFSTIVGVKNQRVLGSNKKSSGWTSWFGKSAKSPRKSSIKSANSSFFKK
jgi:hypothetical protein